MKRFVAIALLCVALTGQTQRTDMTDAEITEFIHNNRTITELQKKASEAIAAVQSYNAVLQKRFEETKKAHGAEGCKLDAGLRWTDCPVAKK